MERKKHILIAPLDWGLGHTTRCIPLIKKLIKRGHTVTVACNDFQKLVLEAYELKVNFVFLEGYNVTYAKKGRLALKIMGQIPKIMSAIKIENNWVKKYVKQNKIDVIISDNRFGFYHPLIESIYITHQINVQSSAFINPMLYKIHDLMITNFHHCWIPDTPNNIYAGELSVAKNKSFHYIGLLSRFENLSENITSDSKYDYSVIISGPEPQRSIFENHIINCFNKTSYKTLIITSGELSAHTNITNKDIDFKTLPNPKEFSNLIEASSKIILRSGYTSIMDFAVLQKPVFFVPTKGQTEQEYLANFHKTHSNICWSSQDNFTIPTTESFANLPTYLPHTNGLLDEALEAIGL